MPTQLKCTRSVPYLALDAKGYSEASETISVGRNKAIQARSARWRFRRIWVVFAGNARSRCRSNRLIPAYMASEILLRSVRQQTGLSQQAFADLIKTPVATLRDWEQGRFNPPGGVICLLKLMHDHPELKDELAA